MTKIVKIAVTLLIGFILGFLTSKNNAFISIIKVLDWPSLLYWLTLFLGALVPIVINYLLVKQQEVVKLKAKFAQDKIDIIRGYVDVDLYMRSTVVLEKSINDLTIKYKATEIDESAPLLRGLFILQQREEYDKWKLESIKQFEKLSLLGSREINDYTWYISTYLLNLEHAIMLIPDRNLWEVSIYVKNDFFDMSNELGTKLDKFLDQKVFMFRNEKRKTVTEKDKRTANEKLSRTNLFKYRGDFSKLSLRKSY